MTGKAPDQARYSTLLVIITLKNDELLSNPGQALDSLVSACSITLQTALESTRNEETGELLISEKG